jgi:hypothetical protein
LPVVLYGHETWYEILREEHRLRVFENRLLKKIYGPKRDEMVRGWRKLINDDPHNIHTSPSIIVMIKSRRMRWTGNVARMRRRGMHIGFWWESQKERGPKKARHRWVCDTRMDLRKIRWGGMDWIDLAQDGNQCRDLVNAVMNIRVP